MQTFPNQEKNCEMDFKSVATGIIIGAGLATILAGYRQRSRDEMIAELGVVLSSSINGGISSDKADPRAGADVEEEQFIRNEQFFGELGQSKIRSCRVIVVGVGGVGSHCAVTLARSGVGAIRLIDFDRVTVSSLNRHASATHDDVGLSKVMSIQKYIQAFAPNCSVDPVEALFKYDSAEDLISRFNPDWVVDAIDNIHTKADLLAYCHQNGIKVVSACGSAAKCDPTRIRISTVEGTSEDPLARAIRQRLRLSHKLTNTGIPVVYSTERTSRGLLPLKDFQEDNPQEYQALDKFRVRILPVIAPLPAIMGNAIASYILCEVAEQPFTPHTTSQVTSVTARKKLWNFIRRFFPAFGPQIADSPDGEMVLDIVYDACAGRSVISGDAGNLCLVPFRDSLEGSISPSNLVLMTTTEAKTHITDTPFVESDRIQKIRSRVSKELEQSGIVS